MHPADPLGSLTPAEAPLIEAEKLSEQAGPPHLAAKVVYFSLVATVFVFVSILLTGIHP
jgi:hypothetical protein